MVCQHSNGHFSVARGGRSDINQQLQSQKHRDAEKILASAKNISLCMRRDADTKSDKIAATEALFAYMVCHGQTFHANNCSSTLINS